MLQTSLLSIVIPTLNRYDTLIPLIRALCSFESQKLEVIVHDNSIDNETFLRFYNLLKDSRIKYFHVEGTLSAIENCNLAVSKATGRYVCFIGDDDGVSEQIISCCEWMSEIGVESVIFNRAIYTWPGTEHYFKLNNKSNGKLIVPPYSGQIQKLSIAEQYKKIVRSGGQSMFHAPRLYHGIISKESLDQLYANYRTYFPGPVPDMSNCIALSKYVKSHFFIDLPIVITGQSSKSMSGKNANRKHQGEIKKETSLPAETSANWDRRIPFYWSGPTIWAQALVEASTRIGYSFTSKNFNYANLYAYCLAFTSQKYYPRVFKVIFDEFKFFDRLKIIFSVIFYLMKISLIRLRILTVKFFGSNEASSYDDIETVIGYINTSLSNKSLFEKN